MTHEPISSSKKIIFVYPLNFPIHLHFFTFVNGKKVPLIPPLLVNGKLTAKKAKIFNDFFSQQCQPISSNDSIVTLTPTCYTNKTLNDIIFNYYKILKVIQSLDRNKAHGRDGTSVRMLKLSCPFIIKPLHIILCKCLKLRTFSDDWKKGNVVPVHKKGSKPIVSDYRPVFLLHICSKVFL